MNEIEAKIKQAFNIDFATWYCQVFSRIESLKAIRTMKSKPKAYAETLKFLEPFAEIMLQQTKRMQICREAVLLSRSRSQSIIMHKREDLVACGSIGIMDFIKTGDVHKILLPEVRAEVQKLLIQEALKSGDDET